MQKKVFIKTFGCQMNEYDSDKMADVLVTPTAMSAPTRRTMPTSSCSTPARCAKRRRRKYFPTWAGCKRSEARQARSGDRRRRLRRLAGRRGHRQARAVRRPGVRPANPAPAAAAMLQQRRDSGAPQVDISFPEIEKFDQLPPAKVDGADRLRLDHGRLQQVLQLSAWCPTPAARKCRAASTTC